MNITDIKETKEGISVEVTDLLKTIFEEQMKLKKKYDEIEMKKGFFVPDISVFSLDLSDTKNQMYLKDLFYRIVTELVEASECLKNKPWKMSEVPTDVDHLKEELVDALHFYVELCINVGIDSEELFNLYMKKNKVNQWRQETNY